MKHMSRIYSMAIALFIMGSLQAQNDFMSLKNFAPPSPEAAALGRYGQVPVNYASGIPTISIPLYEVKSRQLSVPVSLTYHAAGIKVEDIATVAGLGWALNAGGVISRNVVGKADEFGMRTTYPIYQDRLHFDNAQYDSSNGNFDYLNNMSSGNIYDSQSDIYDINTPYFTGRFVFNIHTKEIHHTPVDKQLKIQWNTSNSTFTIIDDRGIQYLFTEKENTTAERNSSVNIDITAWYNTMMISADKTDTIFFKYKAATDFTDVFDSQNYSLTLDLVFDGVNEIGNCPVPTLNDHFDIQPMVYTYQRKLLDSIQFANGFVKFNYVNDRQDPGVERLKTLNIGNNSGVINTVELVHTYFQTTKPFAYIPDKASKRLKLDEVQFKDNAGILINKYSLGYNTAIELPCYYKIYNGPPAGKAGGYDFWGYYNGGGDYLLPAQYRQKLVSFLLNNHGIVIESNMQFYDSKSSDRNPNPQYTQACILQKIVYPTGGYSVYEYENNKINNNGNNSDYTGGLRVKKITTIDNFNKPRVKTFQYGNEEGVGIPITRVIPEDFYYVQPVLAKNPNILGAVFCHSNNFYLRTNPVNAINYYAGSPVFYSKVTEFDGYPGSNNGKTEYEFEFESDSGYNAPVAGKYWNYSTDKSWARGSLLTTKVFKSINNAYSLVKEIKNEYISLGRKSVPVGYICEQRLIVQQMSLEGYLIYWSGVGGNTTLLNFFEYSDIVLSYGVKKLVKTEEIDYLNNNISSKKEFFYESPNHLYNTTIKTYGSNNDVHSEITRYPQDKAYIQNLSPAQGVTLDGMIASNILEMPVETESYHNTSLLYRNRSEFVNWNNSGRFYETFRNQQVGQNPMEQRIQFKEYDNRGNLLSLSKVGDHDVSYIWGYQSSYPIAQVTNAAFNEIAYTSFEIADDGNWTTNSSIRNGVDFYTGKYGYDLSNGAVMKAGLTSGKPYIISYWSKNGNSKMVNGSNGVAKLSRQGWTLYEHVLSATSITVSGGGVIDELRLYPKESQMISYTYSPLIGVTTMSSVNDIVNRYEYDNYGRLLRVRDDNNYIIKQVDYKYQQVDPTAGNWQLTGNDRFVTGIGGYPTGIRESEENNNITGQTRWIVSGVVPVSPQWTPTSETRCKPNALYGEMQMKYQDINPYSTSFLETRWNDQGTSCTCIPLSTCNSPQQKVINGCCEWGIKVYTNFYYQSLIDKCQATFHYEWSDGSWSQNYIEEINGVCPSED